MNKIEEIEDNNENLHVLALSSLHIFMIKAICFTL